ncbi:hypothetical protein KKC87_04445 [Patescibacteria group bacterium]|nr:hypothetical protein [Patescibacteria group bacterium]
MSALKPLGVICFAGLGTLSIALLGTLPTYFAGATLDILWTIPIIMFALALALAVK